MGWASYYEDIQDVSKRLPGLDTSLRNISKSFADRKEKRPEWLLLAEDLFYRLSKDVQYFNGLIDLANEPEMILADKVRDLERVMEGQEFKVVELEKTIVSLTHALDLSREETRLTTSKLKTAIHERNKANQKFDKLADACPGAALSIFPPGEKDVFGR